MLTNPQKALIKQAQRQCRLNDADYRQAMMEVAGTDTCTDEKLSDRHCDRILSYLEAIYWRAVDSGAIPDPDPLRHARAAFRLRGYWASKNTRGENSRDRFTDATVKRDIESLERQLAEDHGCGPFYFHALRRKIKNESHYRAALKKTLSAKQQKQPQPADQPF